MSDKRTSPIEPLQYLSGVKVVDIGDFRVARGMSRRPASSCRHRQLRYDQAERRIWCQDCETDVEPFDAFLGLVEGYSGALDRISRETARLKEAEQFAVRSLAAKEVDKVWRSKNMVPACPHCSRGLFPEHFKNGMATLGRDYAERLLEREKRGQP